MSESKIKTVAFLTALKDVMITHDVDCIIWVCGEGSDEHGIYDDGIHIEFNSKDIEDFKFGSECVTVIDIEVEITSIQKEIDSGFNR